MYDGEKLLAGDDCKPDPSHSMSPDTQLRRVREKSSNPAGNMEKKKSKKSKKSKMSKVMKITGALEIEIITIGAIDTSVSAFFSHRYVTTVLLVLPADHPVDQLVLIPEDDDLQHCHHYQMQQSLAHLQIDCHTTNDRCSIADTPLIMILHRK